jgi:hypothetical protein
MNLGLPLGTLSRLILRPVSWPTVVLVALPTLLLLYLAIDPAIYYMAANWILALAYMVVVGAILFGRAVLRVVACEWRRQPSPRPLLSERTARRLLVATIVVAVAVVLKLPMHAAFWISKPWLDDLATAHVGNPAIPSYAEGPNPSFTFSPRRAGPGCTRSPTYPASKGASCFMWPETKAALRTFPVAPCADSTTAGTMVTSVAGGGGSSKTDARLHISFGQRKG